MLLLALDSADATCSAALWDCARPAPAALLGQRRLTPAGGQADHLIALIDDLLRGLGVGYPALDVLAVNHGPGSFTGVRSAVAAVFRHNFRPDLSHEESTQRAYGLGDEGGLVTASWPKGGRPRIPFIYSDEVWTGIEYQVATQLIFEGFVEEGLTVVRAVRARHTGEFRSPWDDIEAGHHYARSLAAWGLLIAASGVQYDGIARTLSFDPIADGRYPFTTGTAWGVATIARDTVTLDVRGGRLDLASLSLRGRLLPSVE